MVPADPSGRGFDVIACDHPTYETREKLAAAEAVAEIAELLRPWGMTAFDAWTEPRPRTTGWTDARLGAWRERGQTANTALIWVSHGDTDIDKREAHLIVRGEPGSNRDSEISPDKVANEIEEQYRDRGDDDLWRIVVIEACGGARFVTLVTNRLKVYDKVRRTLVVGSGADRATQFLGTLATGLHAVLSQVTEDELPLARLVYLLKQITEPDGSERFSVRGLHLADSRLRRSIPGPVTAVWTDYEQLRRALDALTTDSHERRTLLHYATKGTGTDLGEFAGRFVGQTDERRRIFDWLRSMVKPTELQSRLLIVHGPPGSGKSALLGSILIDCRPEFANAINTVARGRTAEPPAGDLPTFDLALHLTGATVRSTAVQLLACLAGGTAAESGNPTAEVHRRVQTRRTPLFILADALDEAAEPIALAHFFDELCQATAVRLVIGTRDRIDRGVASLLAVLRGRSPGARDSDIELQPRVADVVESLAVRIADAQLRERVRAGAGRRFTEDGGLPPEHQFLWAAMAAEEINAGTAELSGAPELLDELLATDHRALFGMALERLGGPTSRAYTALFALALAHGRGLPRQDRIWEEVATALAPGHEPVTCLALNAVLDAAGAYVMLDHDQGQGVYRLAHRVLQEQLLEDAADLPARQLYVFRQLLGHVRPDQPLNAYLRAQLATHARVAGPQAWTELAGRHDVLDRLDPYAVASAAMGSGPLTDLPVEVRGTITTAHLVRDGRDDDRAGLRMLGMAWVAGNPGAGASAPAPTTWSVRWSLLPRRPAHLAIGANESPPGACALAVLPTPQGPSLLVVAAGDRTVRIWDPVTGEPARPTFDLATAHGGHAWGRGVAALAAFESEGRPFVAGAPVGGHVVVWHAETGKYENSLENDGVSVVGLSAYRAADGGPRLAVVWRDGTIERRNPATGAREKALFDAQRDSFSTVVTVELPQLVVLVGMTPYGRIRAWDAWTGRPWGAGAQLPHEGVDLAPVEATAERIVLAVVGGNGCHRCVLKADATTEADPELPPLLGDAAIRRVATVDAADGRRLVVLADAYGEIRFRDAAGGSVDGWHAHRGQLDALVANCPSDRAGWALATIAKTTGTADVWPMDVFAGLPAPDSIRQVLRVAVAGPTVALAGRAELTIVAAVDGHQLSAGPAPGLVTGLTALGAAGRFVVAARHHLWCWSPDDEPRDWSHPVPVRAVAAATDDGADRLVTLDEHGTLRVWDTSRGVPLPPTADTGARRMGPLACYRDGDDLVVAVGRDATVQRFRCRFAREVRWERLPAVAAGSLPTSIVAASAVAGDPAALVVVTAGRIRCVAPDGADRWVVAAPAPPVAATVWRTGGGRLRLAVATELGEIFVFDGGAGQELRRVPTGLGVTSLQAGVQGDRTTLVLGAREGAIAIDLPPDGGPGA